MENKKSPPFALLIGAIVAIVLLAGVVVYRSFQNPTAAAMTQPISDNDSERDAAPQDDDEKDGGETDAGNTPVDQ